jgi:hypothetical protein
MGKHTASRDAKNILLSTTCSKCGSKSNLYSLGVKEKFKQFRCLKISCKHIDKVSHDVKTNKGLRGLNGKI